MRAVDTTTRSCAERLTPPTSIAASPAAPPPPPLRSPARRRGPPHTQGKREHELAPRARGGSTPGVWSRGRGWRGEAGWRSFGRLCAGIAATVEPHRIRRPTRGRGRCGHLFRILLYYAEQTSAVLMRASFGLVAHESALPEPHTEHLLCLRLLAGIVAPHLVLLVEGSRRRHDAFAHYAPVFDKRGEGVHLSPVLVCCRPHALWFYEAVLLPLETAFDHPRQDAGHLGP